MDSLSDIYAALLAEAEDRIGEAAYGPDPATAGRLYETLVDTFEGLAACNLLLEMDLDQFRTDLIYSAAAREQFLKMCAHTRAEPLHRALSRTNALFCALAARDEALATRLVRLGPAEWLPDGEYEDDFCYHAFVATLAAPAEAAFPPDLIDRFARALDGRPSPRLDVCRAFADDDPAAFAVAFEDLLLAHERWAEENEAPRRDQPAFLASRLTFVEGLALIALAGARGWPQPDETPLCPVPARLGPSTAHVPDLYREIERLAAGCRRDRGLPPTL